MESQHDSWSAGQSYERYMGRWSARVAASFLDWLSPPAAADWIEVGCGTGALTRAVLGRAAPRSILATDASADFVQHAAAAIADPRASFAAADARDLPAKDESADVVTSALVLNFVPDRVAALREMQRVLRPGGILSFYVWDYPGGGLGFLDAFWSAAAKLDPAAAELDEGRRFPFCTATGLAALCAQAGLPAAEVAAVEVRTEFADFDAFWHPFALGAGPAPGYVQSLDAPSREALRARLAADLGAGPVDLPARAWAVRAVVR